MMEQEPGEMGKALEQKLSIKLKTPSGAKTKLKAKGKFAISKLMSLIKK